jgi:hypothetical protein
MTLLKKITRLLCAIPCLAVASHANAARVFHGNYTISYFVGPNHNETGSLCAVFSVTGNIDGFAASGTWRSPDVPGMGGNYVVDGTTLRFYGTYNNGLDTINHYATITDKGGQGGFDRWFSGVAPLTPIDDGTIVIGKGCAGG